jgi:hypothetical protein
MTHSRPCIDKHASPRNPALPSMPSTPQHPGPPILRLPSELHLQITSFLSTSKTKCIPLAPRASCTSSASHVHNEATAYTVRTTDASILSLRSTNRYFCALIPVSQDLLLQVERTLKGKKVLACCVCLRLRSVENFAISEMAMESLSTRQGAARTKYRFCIDCGFRAYPALSLQGDGDRTGEGPAALTMYAPCTMIMFPPGRRRAVWGEKREVWVWCMDCRELKKGEAAGDLRCHLFCKECCERLGCCHEREVRGMRRPYRIHRGYGPLDNRMEGKRMKSLAGTLVVDAGCSLLVQRQRERENGNEGDGEELDEQTRKEWFDFGEVRAFLPQPPEGFGQRRKKHRNCLPSSAAVYGLPPRTCGSVHAVID